MLTNVHLIIAEVLLQQVLIVCLIFLALDAQNRIAMCTLCVHSHGSALLCAFGAFTGVMRLGFLAVFLGSKRRACFFFFFSKMNLEDVSVVSWLVFLKVHVTEKLLYLPLCRSLDRILNVVFLVFLRMHVTSSLHLMGNEQFQYRRVVVIAIFCDMGTSLYRQIRRYIRAAYANADALLRAGEKECIIGSDALTKVDIAHLPANRPTEDHYASAKCLTSDAYLFGIDHPRNFFFKF